LAVWLAFASLAAVCFGLRGILYQWTAQKKIERNLMLLGVYVCGAFVAGISALAMREAWSPAVWTGAVMGLFSFASNASMYKGFAVGKASLVAVFTALTPVVVAGLSFALWGETLNGLQAAAFVVILAGIVLIRYSGGIGLSNRQGLGWAMLAMLFFGITDVSSKQAMLWEAAKLPTLFVMYMTGAGLFFLLWLSERVKLNARRPLSGESSAKAYIAAVSGSESAEAAAESIPALAGRPSASGAGPSFGDSGGACASFSGTLAAVRGGPTATLSRSSGTPAHADVQGLTVTALAPPDDGAAGRLAGQKEEPAAAWPGAKTFAWGLAVGLTNISGMIFILPAFQLGITGLVSAVVATNVLLILLYARLFLKERLSRKELAGVCCALIGVLALRLLE
jgi:drug/metabolite transporter (DMT)-like permease